MRSKLLRIVIGLVIVAIFGYLLQVAFAGDPLEDIKQVGNLNLTQNGLEVTANWSEMDCDGYEVKVFRNGKLTVIPKVKDNMYTVCGVYPGDRCVIMVSGHLGHGLMSRNAKAVITADRLEQNIAVGDTSYYGFADDGFNLKASANGKLHYLSSDKNIAKVDRDGNVKLKNDGETQITITADENGLFKEEERTVDIFVYPTVLDKIKGARAENISPTRAIIKWKKHEYAAAYTVLRQNPATEQYQVLTETPAETNFLEVTRDNYNYEIKAVAEINGQTVDGKVSDPVAVRGTTEDSQTYSNFKIIKTLRDADFDVIAEMDGTPKVKIPQAMSIIGNEYVVSTDMKNTNPEAGDMIAFNKTDGSINSLTKITGIGHGNGSAYNPNTNRLYILSEKKGQQNQWCCVYDGTTKEFIEKIVMPVPCTSIAYDISTDKFYLAKSTNAYVCSSNFKVEKSFTKTAPSHYTQDMGGYNGALICCTFPGGRESYIDIYRASDGAYLGSYDMSFGEAEACEVDDGYLVVLMNTGVNDDRILRSKERIAIP